MRKSRIPLYCFPTTVVFIDDKKDFLVNFCLKLENIAYKLFESPTEAIPYIKSQCDSRYVTERSIDVSDDNLGNPITDHSVKLSLSAIRDEIYNPLRFKEIAVVVVDYDMPGMNGIEFCRRLMDRPVKKIMLTGKGDEKVAIEAFNEGVIDQFIQKSNNNVIEVIEENIRNLEKKYFREITKEMCSILEKNTSSFINDPLFSVFFNNLCKEHNIVEYYLLELTGTFLMLNEKAEPSLLIVRCYDDLSVHYEFAQESHAPAAVLEAMRSGDKIPFTWNAEDYFNDRASSDWEKLLFPAEELMGENEAVYYYSFVKNAEIPNFQQSKIASYENYLESVENENLV
jgi:CheY-like chemotaxis protein